MTKSKSKQINRKFNDRIDSILSRISNKSTEQSSDADEDELLQFNSETVTKKIGENDSVISQEIVDKFEKPEPTQDIEELKEVVAIRNDYNSHRKELIDTGIKAGMSVVGILLMLGFEMSHSITSKSLSFLPKPRI